MLTITAISLGLGCVTTAQALPGAKAKGATLQDLTQTSFDSPELAAAEQRVEQAKAQVELANKQVGAARALLKAAQADLKASIAQLDALKANATAQGLVEKTGMTPAKAAPVAVAAKSEVKDKELTTAPTQATATSTNAAPAAAPTGIPATAPSPAQTGDDSRIKTDFNNEQSTTEPIQLR